MNSHQMAVLRQVGLCPQEDPLWPLLTLHEHLECYASLRGVRRDQIRTLIDGLIKGMNVSEHQHKFAKDLSGGTRRKLTFMLSLIGNPLVALLDEPSTGLDPLSRHRLWDAVHGVFAGSQRACILTTHHMEEADVVCGRLAILVNGKMQCLGSVQHLKRKHGSGYVLELELTPLHADDPGFSPTAENADAVAAVIAGAKCTEHFGTRRVYWTPRGLAERLSDIFSALEQMKQRLIICEYSFSQSTLEQVFLHLARSQTVEIDLPATVPP
jgi:ATP-binding cassette subfamily A (ABC1) protein 5